ncbi:hypothetical protein NCC78_21575 [Micromonospora phytophila]|uniref:hypothetical protein n=1 Tax=Micromonospora phytophila TaxID=709888 RepID=UPI00202EEE3D|nr:hypothetical protein [Micromonospora phytophila]MCM0677257.1 hypothetical protein [Micromonospora phytophila]
MAVARHRSTVRSTLGLAAVTPVLAAVVACAPPAAESPPAWQPPAGFAVTETVTVADGRTLRLWTGPSGWYVESLTSGRHEAAVGAGGGGDRYAVSVVLDGLVGTVPVASARAVEVGSPPVRADLHSGVFLVPATVVAAPTDQDVLVTPLDATGRSIAPATRVPIVGRG